ncbi:MULTISPECIES: tripartite tricarboxylate transporter substrate binding protein [unclassified Variovorax]|uniref:Bug family tripartite tricarboxylate transporter substrate binding protein n=1 Tax=unclassified Variovorax TaxID=663243 RepID=UPI0008BCA3A7|nr:MULTISPECIES: tripartite tricarboxylate transporter substrate binding protein [unclassified Variovorax]SEK17345.1 Tripartite-type tricarboxylate transporter, receptor component TctC [Variovorax sp. OK202]SFE80399.1 Tripartite-type tricarboxylate transporter, receptor component TctC [Variovorax sp. OK212]
MKNIVSAVALAAATSLLVVSQHAAAQFQPTRPVRITVPFSAGSGPDAAIRAVALGLSQKWKQPVVIDNRPGGNGFIGINLFKNLTPDGHELFDADGGHVAVHPHTFSKLPYDPVKDLEPVRFLLLSKYFVAVPANSRFRTVDDIVRAAKEKPEGVTYGSFFIGSPPHLGGLQLESLTGAKMLHVPYKDTVQLYTAVANGEVDWALGSLASAGPLEKSGKLKFITVAAAKRFALYPAVPASSESSTAKSFSVTGWNGLFAPRGTPKRIRDQIANDVSEVLASPQIVERYRNFGYEDVPLQTDGFAQFIVKESADWKKVVQAAGLKLDQ